MKITVEHLDNLIYQITDSKRIFGIVYEKKNGEITKFNARFGVHKFLKGGQRTIPQSMYVIWDNNRKGYRALEPSNIIQLTFNKCRYVRAAGYEFVKL
jgi:hypothetical protein